MKPSREKIALAFIVLLLVIIFGGVWGRLQTGPPRRIVFAAGVKGGAYYSLAEKYAALLANSGLEVEILETHGSRENIELLEQGKADIAFAQSGLRSSKSEGLRSLGSVFFEPVWVFLKGESPKNELLALKNKKVGVGEPGSGTMELALTLLADNKLTNQVQIEKIGGKLATDKLVSGELDALFLVGAAALPSVKTLAHTKGISLLSFDRAEAYSRYHDSLTAVTLYQGMLNLAENIPEKDHRLIATSANLVVSEDFHYALVTLILQTAQKIHRAPGPFSGYDEFPNPRMATFALVPEAESFYRRGPSFFFRNLPFYPAAALDRLIILLLPLLTLLIPLGKILPPLYAWIQQRQLYKKQAELARIELNEDELPVEERIKQVKLLQEGLADVKTLPPVYQNDVFLFQLRTERVLENLDKQQQETASKNE